ncbi:MULTISPECIES: Ig-like domain-containing protein [Streptomyces]|uniref:Putative L,D-transpeptidase LppS n=1 Tax=Streptomyces jeddahensis TaxID=1716141 RepID=A0A177HKE3_9ACTN|nr:Ig-like domain-containing protein [Streptomyces jeddahensis]OAH10704.1 putative L,D-transpeptidase LppS precursor [Streptomyces jeddahensis]
MHRTRPAAALAALSISACLLAGCSTRPGDESDRRKASPAASGAAATPHIRLNAADGQKHVSVRRGGRVTVEAGRITNVSLATANGRAVRGAVSSDGRTWAPDAVLDHGTAHRLTVVAAGADGRKVTKKIAFTTVAKTDRFTGTFTPDNGSTVGVGMPVSFTFDKAITEKKAVESAIEVSSSSGQPVVGHWFGARRLDFRPQQYWRANSTITVRIRLDGIKGAEGAYGEQDKTVRFTVGRSQVSTVDAATHRMTVVRDGKTLKTIAITAGAENSPTWNGQMVISEKLISTRMNGATVGFAGEYDIPDVPHAMRLSTSGTFIHGNYWGADSVFGRTNISHGCVGLNDARGGGDPTQDGAWFYNNSLLGDVVVVRNSDDRTIAPDNGLNGWNMPWDQWKAGSAR